MYAVANSDAAVAAACGKSRQENGVQRDHSLEILSVLHQPGGPEQVRGGHSGGARGASAALSRGGGRSGYLSEVTLNMDTGRWNPFSTASPAGSAFTRCSIRP